MDPTAGMITGTITGTTLPTSTEVPELQPSQAVQDSRLMQLMWLASPALPIGGFSYSEGLEALVNHTESTTELVATEWLIDHLHLTLARGDLAVVAKAIEAWRRTGTGDHGDPGQLATLNAWVLQTRESSEFRAQTEEMGRSLLE